jgi:hypothetical protein
MKTILSRFGAIVCLIAPLTGAAQYTTTSITTITNPRPADIKLFGWSMAAMGNDRVLIGAINFSTWPYGGSAYLFNTAGSLLTTFTNPASASHDEFGFSVTALGGNKVIVSAPSDNTGAILSGAAYLFNTNGILLASITNPAPTPSAYFGVAMAAVGSDMVIVGAPMEEFLSPAYVGAAYLFDANGSLLTTFTNPAPADANSRSFGVSVAALGNDRVLIGTGHHPTATVSRAAYLFNINGTLLTTFTNPTPASDDLFGRPVAALGNDRVLIGAQLGEANAVKSGTAYLFSTNGTLLTTFTNPAPTGEDSFGSALAALGDDRILIGAHRSDTFPRRAGAAYLFDTNGTLLTVFTNSAASGSARTVSDMFGYSLAIAGNDQILIGAPTTEAVDDTGVGVVQLFSISAAVAPALSIRLTPTNTLAVVWPSPSTGFTLQQNTNSVATANWSNVTDLIQDDGTNRTLIIAPSADKLFYRLSKP